MILKDYDMQHDGEETSSHNDDNINEDSATVDSEDDENR